VNDAVQIATDGLLTNAGLAERPDFTLGLAAISPSTRAIVGPGGTADVEPRIMQVLVVLADAAGQVVTRETLFQRCWGGVYVGDDSLNRVVAAIRKLAGDIAGGSFEIETIPRTGYRLTQTISLPEGSAEDRPAATVSRRGLIASGAAAAAITGGAGLWWATRPRSDPRFDGLMAKGDEALRNGTAFENATIGANNNPSMIRLYQEAVQLEPDSARAWGLLGYFKSSANQDATAKDSARLVGEADTAIRRALELDPDEPNARVGMFLLQGTMYDWAARDRLLRGILATDPANLPAMLELMPLLQSAGLTRESWMWNERMLHAAPFTRVCLVVRALKLWIMGRVLEADNVIDRVRALWPDYTFAIYARFTIFALTGRPQAARALLDSKHALLADETRGKVLDALETRSRVAIDSAQLACLQVAQTSPPLANDVVMYLCALGLTDTAFDVTDGFLLWRGKMVSENQVNGKQIDDYSRRMTQWLFTPPVANMRADPRFPKLCDDFGLGAYWRSRGVKPDYLVYG